MDLENELELKRKLKELDHNCLLDKINLIIKELNLSTEEQALELIQKYKESWTFTKNVSTSGDSLIVTLPKKKAKELGINQNTPVLVSIKKLRFNI